MTLAAVKSNIIFVTNRHLKILTAVDKNRWVGYLYF